jgi:hypothetical protein
MKRFAMFFAVLAMSLGLTAPGVAQGVPPLLELPELCTFSSTGSNPYFVLEPGWTLELAGIEEGEEFNVTITVLDEVREVAGVETRVVHEVETLGGRLVEKSWNWFAICEESGSVFYFGEDVDIYDEAGQNVVAHDGAWEAGIDNARPGVMMPGEPAVGHVHLQEIAPAVALDTALVISVTDPLETPAGTFTNTVHTLETTPLEPGSISEKWYAPGIGLAVDGAARLVSYGF